MDLDGYLEKVDNGGTVTYGEIAEDDPEGAVELFDQASFNNGTMEVSSADAADMYNDTDPIDYIETAIKTLDFSGQYGAGRNSAHKNATEASLGESSSEFLNTAFDSIENNDNIAKVADVLAAGSGVGFFGSAAAGSVHGMGASITAGLASSGVSARVQGSRDKWVEEAADGLGTAYGDRKVEIV